MADQTFELRTPMPVSAEELFLWHDRPGAFQRLCPPFDPVRLIERTGGIRDGDRATIEMHALGKRVRWVAEHSDWAYGERFTDTQVQGPFKSWVHEHLFEPEGRASSVMHDRIRYRLPMGVMGRLFGGSVVREKLNQTFGWRHTTLACDLELHQICQPGLDAQQMGRLKVLVSGASGMIGSALCALLRTAGHEVTTLVRRPVDRNANEIRWNVAEGEIDPAKLEGFDAVVHLAGESVASGRWNAAKKEAIRSSRVDGTRLLCDALARLDRRPRVYVQASACGFYGDRGDEKLSERAARGQGFLAEVTNDWEESSRALRQSSVRTVFMRYGMVLDPRAGALAKMLPAFRMGGGGPVGSGKQWWSWISLDDAIASILYAISQTELAGAVNATAPEPVTSRDFSKALGRVLKRPAIVPAPAKALRLAFGELADGLLLSSNRVLPTKLEATGFPWRDTDLEYSLRRLLGRL